MIFDTEIYQLVSIFLVNGIAAGVGQDDCKDKQPDGAQPAMGAK